MAKEAHDSCPRVFVYGTLRSGWGNNRILQQGNARKIGDGRTNEDGFCLYGHGLGFPYVVDDGDGYTSIAGEVWEVNAQTMLHCDRLEGYPYHYDRQIVEVRVGDELIEAWMYFVDDRRKVGAPDSALVESGDWKDAVRFGASAIQPTDDEIEEAEAELEDEEDYDYWDENDDYDGQGFYDEDDAFDPEEDGEADCVIY